MRIQEVMIHLLLKQPFYGYIAASVTPVESREIQTTKIITAPSFKLLYNPDWFGKLKDDQAIGALMHELLHLMLLHPFRKDDRERHLWLIACDMAVNEHIDSFLLPEASITVELISREIREELPRFRSAEFYYDSISRNGDCISFMERESNLKVLLGNGQELVVNSSTETDASEVSARSAKSLITELIAQAGSEGEIPAGIGDSLNDIYKTSDVNWRNVLKRFLTGKGRVKVRKTCKKVSRRFDDLPGSKRSVGTSVLVALDESGSISDKQVMEFFKEMLEVKKITGADIRITQFDTTCTDPVPVEQYIRKKARVKNGGTDFRPVFQLADKLRVPLLIIFTDGEGPAPDSANQKVLWVLTGGGKMPVDFGDSIVLDQ